MTAEFWFWAASAVAVIITGISKGGMGGIALFAVPLMALVMSPVQAAAIMLPILIVMDWFSLAAWRKTFNLRALKIMLPGAVIGITLGGLTAGFVNDDSIRILVGIIAVGFTAFMAAKVWLFKNREATKGHPVIGAIAGTVAGFTSFIAHAGGPPVQSWLLPQQLKKEIYTGTSVWFFTVVNAVKLIPYYLVGQLAVTNLKISLMLMPLAPIGVGLGVWMVKRVPQKGFYAFMYVMIFLVGLKLLWDGVQGLI